MAAWRVLSLVGPAFPPDGQKSQPSATSFTRQGQGRGGAGRSLAGGAEGRVSVRERSSTRTSVPPTLSMGGPASRSSSLPPRRARRCARARAWRAGDCTVIPELRVQERPKFVRERNVVNHHRSLMGQFDRMTQIQLAQAEPEAQRPLELIIANDVAGGREAGGRVGREADLVLPRLRLGGLAAPKNADRALCVFSVRHGDTPTAFCFPPSPRAVNR